MTLLQAQIDQLLFSGASQPALYGIRLEIPAGQFIILSGAPGSGKTALLHCLAGIIPHHQAADLQGRVLWQGRDLPPLPELAGQIGVVSGQPENQLFCTTVEEDLAFGPGSLLLPPEEIRARIEEALLFTGLSGYEKRRPETLSGGETQRAVLASVLTTRPQLLLLDHPADQVDPAGRMMLYQKLKQLCRKQNLSLLLVEENYREIRHLADRILVMEKGTVVRDLDPAPSSAGEDSLTDGPWRSLNTTVASGPTPTMNITVANSPASAMNASEITASFPVLDTTEASGPAPAMNATAATSPASAEEGLMPAIQAENISFRYGDDQFALENVSLTVPAGQWLAVLGQNGAGKTTLARCMNGLLRPSSGRIKIFGRDSNGLSVAQLSRQMACLMQNPYSQICCASVREETAFALKAHGLGKKEIAQRVEEILARFRLWDVRDCHPYRLSRSQLQRLALASALITQPPILLADEPASGLDPEEAASFMDILAEYHQNGNTIVMITHQPASASGYAQRTVLMQGGECFAAAPGI